jgi:CBS domain containing-hemolysin-like protein
MAIELAHYWYDLIDLVRFFIANIGEFFATLFLPIRWIFNFLKGLITGFFSTPPTAEITSGLTQQTLDIFNNIPHISLLFWALGAAIGILAVFFIIKKFVHL